MQVTRPIGRKAENWGRHVLIVWLGKGKLVSGGTSGGWLTSKAIWGLGWGKGAGRNGLTGQPYGTRRSPGIEVPRYLISGLIVLGALRR